MLYDPQIFSKSDLMTNAAIRLCQLNLAIYQDNQTVSSKHIDYIRDFACCMFL